MVRRGDWQNGKRHPGQIIYGQNSGRGVSKNAKLREKQKWAIEKPKLDNARRLRGIYFIDPEDKEFKETIKNARKKLETPMAPAMPCKISKKYQHVVTNGKSNKIKSKVACILEASESTRLRMGESLPKYDWGPYCRKWWQFTAALQFGTTNLFLCLKQWDTRSKKQQWIKNGRNLKRFLRWT